MKSPLQFNISRKQRGIMRIILCLVIIIIVAWLALHDKDQNSSFSNNSVILDSPLAIYQKHAEVVRQPLAIQCNSWRLLNQHVYIMDTNGNHLKPSYGLDNTTTINDVGQFKIELGLAGPRTISLYHPLTDQYMQHCEQGAVKLKPIINLANMDARVQSSWIPYVSLANDGSRTYMFAPAADHNGRPVLESWLQNSLDSVSSRKTRFLLRATETGNEIDAPKLREVVSRKGDTSNKDYSTRVVCNAIDDTQDYIGKQHKYMSEYYGYYDRANAEAARVREIASQCGGPPSLDTKENFTSYDQSKYDSSSGANRLVEKFSGSSSSGMHRGNRNKRVIKALKMNGMLDDLAVKSQELFADTSPAPAVTEFNASKANVFQPHTGLQFNDILNHHADTVSHDVTEDRIFDRLERAKMDPSVQNLLDYNEERAKIYQNENQDFEQRLNQRVKENRDQTNELVQRMDQHRIREMSRRLFFLKNHSDQAQS